MPDQKQTEGMSGTDALWAIQPEIARLGFDDIGGGKGPLARVATPLERLAAAVEWIANAAERLPAHDGDVILTARRRRPR